MNIEYTTQKIITDGKYTWLSSIRTLCRSSRVSLCAMTSLNRQDITSSCRSPVALLRGESFHIPPPREDKDYIMKDRMNHYYTCQKDSMNSRRGNVHERCGSHLPAVTQLCHLLLSFPHDLQSVSFSLPQRQKFFLQHGDVAFIGERTVSLRRTRNLAINPFSPAHLNEWANGTDSA